MITLYKDLIKKFDYQGWWPIYNFKIQKFEYHPKDYTYPKNDLQRLEICLGAILTQGTNWKNAERALSNLIKNNLIDKEKLLKIPLNKLSLIIKNSGYHNQKARKIKEFIEFLQSKKEVTRGNLLNIRGIGKETADSILLYAYNKPYFVVDNYTKRILSKLNYCKDNISYDELQDLIAKNIPKDFKIYNEFHALIVRYGKELFNKKVRGCNCINLLS